MAATPSTSHPQGEGCRWGLPPKCYTKNMIQAGAFRILRCYADTDTFSFANLCSQAGYATDLGGYYIRQLVREGLLEKTSRGQYKVTPAGKGYLAVNLEYAHLIARPRLLVLLVASQGQMYLTLRRTRQPYIGRLEWVAGAVDIDEQLDAAAQRLLQDRFGSTTHAELVGFYRRIDRYDGKSFDDKLFAVHTVDFPESAKLLHENAQGHLMHYTSEELARAENPSQSLRDILMWLEGIDQGGSNPRYAEHVYDLATKDLEQYEN